MIVLSLPSIIFAQFHYENVRNECPTRKSVPFTLNRNEAINTPIQFRLLSGFIPLYSNLFFLSISQQHRRKKTLSGKIQIKRRQQQHWKAHDKDKTSVFYARDLPMKKNFEKKRSGKTYLGWWLHNMNLLQLNLTPLTAAILIEQRCLPSSLFQL